jgi:undecaprenyl phosphate N,N'-diacetylbacillosamine 1-phosphate transferase
VKRNFRVSLYVKRAFDILASIGAIIILSPIILFISFLIRFKLGSPILFIQQRVGKNNKIFNIYKFRTMNEKKDSIGILLDDRKRLNRFGMFLRSTSLDELPELLNIIKGDMSLIGPRPLLVEYLPLYSKEQIRRHDVLPGLTGWAQINGRNDILWCQKFKLDIWYIENWTLILDMKIIFSTMYKVLKKEGISQNCNGTTEKFNGEN